MRERLFEYGGQWIGQKHGRKSYYRFWYDQRSRTTRQKALRSKALELAKEELIDIVRSGGLEANHPSSTQVSAILLHYTDHKYPQALRAAKLIMLALKSIKSIYDTPMVSDLTLTNQQLIWDYLNEQQLSSKTIATYCASLRAAVKFSARPVIITNIDGEKNEVRLLSQEIPIIANETEISDYLQISISEGRNYLPSHKDVARWIDEIETDAQFAYVITALNTWARNAAVFDLRVTKQIDFEMGLVDLNPPNRRQTKKFRPVIRLTDNYRNWLNYWGLDKPINRSKKYVEKPLNNIGKKIGMPDFTCYTIRHFMASYVRRASKDVSKEQRSLWLGHTYTKGSRTTDRYEQFDPDYLEDCKIATDEIILEINSYLKTRSLIPPKQAHRKEGNVIMIATRFLSGSDNSRAAAKLTWDNVDEIRSLIDLNVPNTTIATQYGVSEAAIRNIKSGKSWQRK